MAQSKDDIKYATAQARHSAHEPVRVAYTAGTPLEGGMIAESENIDLYPAANNLKQGEPAKKQSQGAAGDAGDKSSDTTKG